MTYDEVVEIERDISLKNEAEKIYNLVMKVKLEISEYKGNGRFLVIGDSVNYSYFTLVNDKFVYQCRFLHNSYDVELTLSGIFGALKRQCRGVDHLAYWLRNPLES